MIKQGAEVELRLALEASQKEAKRARASADGDARRAREEVIGPLFSF